MTDTGWSALTPIVILMASTSVLFISGAGLPAWIWDVVRTSLAVPSAVAPRPSASNASLNDYAQAALDAAPSEDFVIVAHSSGGVVAAGLLGIAPQRVRGMVALTAVLPHPGQSFLRAMPFPNRLVLSAVMRIVGTRPPESAVRASLASGLRPEVQDRLVADLIPESQRYFRDRLPPWTAPTDSLYLPTERDKEIPLELQRRFGALLTTTASPTRTGHLPMLEGPSTVAAVIGSLPSVQDKRFT